MGQRYEQFSFKEVLAYILFGHVLDDLVKRFGSVVISQVRKN
jgi:hypothetical protein